MFLLDMVIYPKVFLGSIFCQFCFNKIALSWKKGRENAKGFFPLGQILVQGQKGKKCHDDYDDDGDKGRIEKTRAMRTAAKQENDYIV